ncbi:MAG TPA: nucleoside triphosphate pyrophosphohydrolase [Afifellaceae bacterium]|nr:nucleoside triphosphate pyrophosphohydrolase [Afifellaceae bacterium]
MPRAKHGTDSPAADPAPAEAARPGGIAAPVEQLRAIMEALRTPGTGCPWDLEQDFRTIAPYTIEEAYEVADAIERGDLDDLKDELGDLLLQVVFHARMAEEIGAFDFDAVAEAICDKLVRRHPHVFGDGAARESGAVKAQWEAIKAEEKAERREQRRRKALPEEAQGRLEAVPATLPALSRALKLQNRAAEVGFDWDEPGAVLDKVEEEIGELRHELAAGRPAPERLEDELGDMMFALVNLARHVGVDPDAALRRTNAKFVRRFRHIEAALAARGQSLERASLEEMEALWQAAKATGEDDRER